MFKISVPIQQCTPIIQFQSEQFGATLRATELKPKLDRYLIRVLQLTETNEKNGESVEVPKANYKDWFLNKDKHLALDYKVKIIAKGEQDKYLPYSIHLNSNKKRSLTYKLEDKYIDDIKILCPCPFFANNNSIKFAGQNIETVDFDNLKFAVLQQPNEKFEIEFFSYIPELVQQIETSIARFFALENFGTRQSKGFGCFSVVGKSYDAFFKNLDKDLFNTDCIFRWDFKNWEKPGNSWSNNTPTDFNNFFDKLSAFYNVLKSGQNHNGYFKSELMKYFYHQPNRVRWEKAKIKSELRERKKHENIWNNLKHKGNENRIETSPFNNNDIFNYIRALLGLAEFIEFTLPHNERQKIHIKNKKIERFRSPITFKFDGNKAYLICYKIPEQLHQNGKYKFALDKDFEQVLDELEIPADFSLDTFFDSNWYNKEGNQTKKTIAQHYNLKKICTTPI